MKSLIIVLIVITASAITGGALAFKARTSEYLFIHQAGSPPDACTLKMFALTTNPVLGNLRITLASTTSVISGCRLITVFDAL